MLTLQIYKLISASLNDLERKLIHTLFVRVNISIVCQELICSMSVFVTITQLVKESKFMSLAVVKNQSVKLFQNTFTKGSLF
ncbi:hypothetical protein EAY46_29605 [Vibrio anguillarum]|uniref:Uncharacterized protein n=1 Tax=Vibrio anguillarum TaxID=55601 RepID=A0ABR9ZF93_VIBAN|nr:hypothetical protein [Vibrio anguillarum]MBF4377134.1 hypothetical protein [Vibrio anguillarum]